MKERRVRTRFAPSPTGFLHIGGIRTALYNYLLARKNNGDFILRIEDTDRTRFVPEAQDYIIKTLKWLKIEPNEGVGFGDGKYGPYIQSKRKEIYKEYAEKLVNSGYAYYAFDTNEELEIKHKELENLNIKNPKYDFRIRESMKNSLTLPEEDVQKKIRNGDPYVIRFKIPKHETIRFYDIIRGYIKVDSSELDDKILLKSDGMATYHLASVVDDYLMEITHIIRGEEWLPSAPLHILMYRAFSEIINKENNIKESDKHEFFTPNFVHLPLLLKPNGSGKLSKRDASEEGLTIFPFSFHDEKINKDIIGLKEKGFLPEAVTNALSLLGWNPGNNEELFTLEELVNNFSLEKIQKSGSRFNSKKFEWFNHQYIKNASNNTLFEYFKEFSNEDTDKLNKICDLVKERAHFTTDIYKDSKYFFIRPVEFDKKNLTEDQIVFSIKWIEDFINVMKDKKLDYDIIHEILIENLDRNNIKMSDVMPTFRLILFGNTSGPDVIKCILILGLDEVGKRILYFKERFLN